LPEILRDATNPAPTRRLAAPTAILDPASEQLVQARIAVAREEAFTQGRSAGRADAEDAVRRAASTVVAALDSLTDEVRSQRSAAVALNMDLVEVVARAVVGACPPTEALMLVTHVRDAVDQLHADEFEVRTHPDDAEALRAALTDRRLRVIDDPTVERGEATVDGGACGARLTRARLLDVALEQVVEDHGAEGRA